MEWRGKEWNGAKKGGMERHGEGGGVGNNGAEATYVSREVRTYVPTYVQPFHCGRLYGMEKGTVTLGILLHFFLHIPYVGSCKLVVGEAVLLQTGASLAL